MDSSAIPALSFALVAFLIFVGIPVAFMVYAVKTQPARNAAAKQKRDAFLAGITAKVASAMTAEKFSAIKIGMAFDDVVAIAGEPTRETASFGDNKSESTVYVWQAGIVANATLTFQDGKLIGKAQFGL